MGVRSVALFAAAAVAEIGGAYMIWIGLREGRGLGPIVVGAVALVLYGLIVAQQPSNEFGRVLAAYGGAFVIGSLLWGVVFDGFEPDRFDVAGAAVCLIGVGMIMSVPR
ncbi:MAG: small multidrug resistance family-3 protein [Solirubrobacterales bacterium]|jgi:small multidrug resistance family-3 protein|nr:small multidrug resistance family-3 protein [Solirubrobacterales bacterium]